MTVQEEIIILERRLAGYQANYDFAVKNNNPIRQTKYRNIIRETKEQIKELERDIPIESNVRLREIIDGLNSRIDKLQEANKELEEQVNELNQRIENFINPPKPKPPEPDEDDHECPKCGRTFKGARGVAVHQRSGACKAAH